MRIGEALRKERLAQGKTQARWVRDVDISVSYYSEIESGYMRNGKRSDIGSEVLLKLLKANNIDVVTFFESVTDSYNVNEKTEKIEKYRRELSIAFNEGNLGKIKVLKENLLKILLGSAALVLIAGWIWVMLSKDGFDMVSLRDRLTPFIPETTSYAKVQKGTQSYNNVQALDPKTGKNLSYKIDHVGGYDPSRSYIAIDHKGQYVRSIDYISKKKFEATKNAN